MDLFPCHGRESEKLAVNDPERDLLAPIAMPTSTVENYIKHIYLAQRDVAPAPVSMGRIATLMGVVPGTATAMVKSLASSGWAAYTPRQGVTLTEEGTKLALQMLRKHRLIEVFLVEVLGYDWSEIHDDAEILEHTVSARLLERIDRLCGHPQFDPHGDPIPTASGLMVDRRLIALFECQPGCRVRIAQILNQEKAFLQFAEQKGLKPGAECRLTDRSEAAAALVLQMADRESVTLGESVARQILVECLEKTDLA